jgi:multidrug efflux pump subunit AcrA (membrane-fusion protein)
MKTKSAVILLVLSWIVAALAADLWAAPQKIGAMGRLKPSKGILAVGVPSGNTLLSVLVDRGDVVRRGTPLMAIQDTGQNKADIALAELDLKEAVSATQKAIDIKKIEANIARMEFDHASSALQRLLSGGADTYSAQSKEDREHVVRTTKSRLEVVQQDLERLEMEREAKISKARMRLEAAKKKLQQVVLASPIDGTVLELLQGPGDIGGGGPALKIADLRQMDAVIEVFEGDVLKLSPGLKATITSKSLPMTMSGKIISIGQIVNTQSRNSEVVIGLDDPGTAAKLINLEVNVSIDLK